jgi:hypothetical protein
MVNQPGMAQFRHYKGVCALLIRGRPKFSAKDEAVEVPSSTLTAMGYCALAHEQSLLRSSIHRRTP